jgi:hypothetical protein
MGQVRVDRPGAGGERLGVPDAWPSEAMPHMRGLMVLSENHQLEARQNGDGIRVRWEASKRRARGVIKELMSEVRKARWMCVRSMSLMMY